MDARKRVRRIYFLPCHGIGLDNPGWRDNLVDATARQKPKRRIAIDLRIDRGSISIKHQSMT
jgi:hypothetical protein